MERKAPTLQSKARHLQVFLCCKSSSSLPHRPHTSFSSTPGMSEVTTDYQTLFALLLHMENHIGCNWSVWQSRKHMSNCHIAIKHFLHPQLQGPPDERLLRGENSTSVYLFNVFTYVRCPESFLRLLEKWSACFPKLVPWPVLMQTWIRKLL